VVSVGWALWYGSTLQHVRALYDRKQERFTASTMYYHAADQCVCSCVLAQ
jgi:hypothetical protein